MKIIKYFLIISLVLFLSDLSVSKFMDFFHNKTYIGMSGGKVNYLLDNFNHIPVLAIGNSRCAHHVVPEVLNPLGGAYNLSHNGMNLVFHTGLINQLVLNEKILIDTILLHVERSEMFNPSLDKERDIQHLKYYFYENEWIKNEIANLSYFESYKYFFSSYKWNGKVVSTFSNYLKGKYVSPPLDGYVAKLKTERDSINVMWSYMKRGEINSSDLKINANFNSYITSLDNLCKKNKIKLICFLSPIYKPNQVYISKTEKLIENYFNDLDLLFYDYSNEFYKNDEIKSIWNWTDDYHMNEKGAFIFTKKLRKDIEGF